MARTIANRQALVVLGSVDRGRLGPCMAALTEKQRKFVWAMLDSGGVNYTECAVAAGYDAAERQTMRVIAHELAHDERIQAAIQEEARKRMGAGALMAAGHLVLIANSPGHKDQLSAIKEILNRSGLHAVTEQRISVTHKADHGDQVKEIIRLAQENGLDPQKVLGSYGIVIDADFNEVKESEAELSEQGDEQTVDDLGDIL